MALLGVNIDHVATLRQARRGEAPEILGAAKAAVSGGADSVTVHLREDRRHIQDRDVADLRKALTVRLNMEMASTEEMVRIARVIHPHSVCLVPEKRQELTTEGGLDVLAQIARLRAVCHRLKSKGILVSLFVDPEGEQIRAAVDAGADAVEIHTGAYARSLVRSEARAEELGKIQQAAALAQQLNLKVNAGHGLDYDNVQPVALIPGVNELNIGFSIISRALFVGLEKAVKDMKALVSHPKEEPRPRPVTS